MSKNIIFYFSGTGNCLDMARNIAAVLGDTDLVSLRNYPALTDTGDAERVGFVFPCYGGGAPADFLEPKCRSAGQKSRYKGRFRHFPAGHLRLEIVLRYCGNIRNRLL